MKLDFFEVLTIIFVIAKLTGYFDYSWWWVFAPAVLGDIIGSLNRIAEERKAKRLARDFRR